MKCDCCQAVISLARKVRLLDLADDVDPAPPAPYRTAFVCASCYEVLNSVDAIGLIDGRLFRLHDGSRFGKAPLFTAEMADDYRRTEAVKLTADAS